MAFQLIRQQCPICGEYRYESPSADALAFEALECVQKEKTFYLAFMPAHFVDACSEVPAIPSMSYEDLADKCLRGLTEWQRELDENRAVDIGNWWAEADSHIVNAPVIAFRDDVKVVTTNTSLGSVKITRLAIPNWLVPECPGHHTATSGRLFDKCPDHRCDFHRKPVRARPTVIIDGQHRVRGSQRGNAPSTPITLPTGVTLPESEIPIPVVVLPSQGMYGFDRNHQAKLFTEITTKSEDLYYLHKLWLLYRFSMSAKIPDLRGMGEQVTMDLSTPQGKRTRDAYETILLLVGTSRGGAGAGNPWRGKVAIFKEDPSQETIATIDRLLPLLYEWFDANGPLRGKLPGQAADELRDYLKAIVLLWDRPSPTSQYYWYPPITNIPGSNPRGVLSYSEGGGMTTWFRALMRIFPTVYNSLPQGVTPGIGHFKTILTPISESFFEGDGWDQIPGREVQEDLLYRILEECVGVANKGRVGVEMQTLGIKNLNEYVKHRPVFVAPKLLNAGPTGPQGLPTIQDGATRIAWVRPFASFRRCKVLITQETKPASKELRKNIDEHSVGELVLDSTEDHFDPNLGGTKVTVRLQYENHMGPETHQMELEVPMSRSKSRKHSGKSARESASADPDG